jgi:hypothetical protein
MGEERDLHWSWAMVGTFLAVMAPYYPFAWEGLTELLR